MGALLTLKAKNNSYKMNIKKIIMIFLCAVLLPSFVFCEYQSNISRGLTAYRQKNFRLAFQYYYAAYKEQPSPKLLHVLKFLKAKINPASPARKEQVLKTGGIPWNWIVIGADALVLGLTVAAGIDYNGEADKYDAMFAAMNNTTPENYILLQKEDAVFNSKQGLFAAGMVMTVLLAGYTAVDAFVLHAAFPLETKMGYDPVNGAVTLAFNCRF